MAILLFFLLVLNVNNKQPNDESIIMEKLHLQVKCWNTGDVDCFMKDYWHHDSLVYIGKNGVTYGWQNTLDNYKQKYPTQEAMGKLSFEIIKIEQLGNNYFSVVGKWHLSRTGDDLEGHFSLLWKKIEGDWVIIADHSS